ncbi:hypothetical protein BKA58DRAFT_310722, partial [Alternaria rosae]|uniref:uncharacterized protein n=1 Tax=Alternaria rosae TaxID=1187941 RepID=UPI001E8D8579
SEDSWHTASSPNLGLPDLPELPEPGMARKTPSKASAGPKAQSKLPQAAATPTPHKSKSTKSLIDDAKSQTPKDRTPIKPAGQEMHPAHHHASTAKILDEARWLGFQSLGAHTAPSKATGLAGQATPSKTPVPTSSMANVGSSPDFRFRFKSPFSKQDDAALSPSSRNILKDAGIAGTPAKGKMARFSDVHMKQFKNMDSIANHPSAFRADPTRFKPVVGHSLKKSPSKPELANPETNKLKRTHAAGGLKRTQSKMDLAGSGSKIPPTPLKRTQSKMDLTGSALPRSQSTARMAPPTRDGRPASRDGDGDRNPVAKRVKRTESDDAASTRPASREKMPDVPARASATPARKKTSQTALPRLAARLMTPTKSSIARSQSVKTLKTTSMIPTLGKSPSTNNLGASPSRVRSILRTPNRKFSDDPGKIAAGTHMSPPTTSLDKEPSLVPATAPVKKQVNFSSSTLERASHDELGKSPSPMKFRAGSEVPAGAVIYPSLGSGAHIGPDLSQEIETLTASPSRRLTFGGETPNHSRSFSFESGKTVNFGPASTGTIRMVRPSDASSLVDGTKRKLETLQETSDKENDGPNNDDTRSNKKMKRTPALAPKAPASASKPARHTPGRAGAISKSRLAFLATPKRSRA